MKKALPFLVASLCVTIIAKAQITKGTVLIGSNLSYITSNFSDSLNELEQSSFNFAPSVGVAVKENVVIGLRAYLGTGKTKYGISNPEYKTNLYGAGLFVRRYVPLGKAVYLFGEGELYGILNNGKQTGSGFKYTLKETRAGLSLYPGISYVVSKHFQLEAGLNNLVAIEYKNTKNETSYANTVTKATQESFFASSAIGGNTGFTLGFRFFLPK